MLVSPIGTTSFRVLGIDPGITYMGVAIIEWERHFDQGLLVYHETLKSPQSLLRCPQWTTHGDRLAILQGHSQRLLDIFLTHRPHFIIRESPFLDRRLNRIQAFSSLIECGMMISQTTYAYNPSISVELVPPASIKKVVGIDPHSKDKVLVLDALLKITKIDHQGVSLPMLSTHVLDAYGACIYKLYGLGYEVFS